MLKNIDTSKIFFQKKLISLIIKKIYFNAYIISTVNKIFYRIQTQIPEN